MTDFLRTRIAAVLTDELSRQQRAIDPKRHPRDPWRWQWFDMQAVADAVISELNIPDRTHVDDKGRLWEWCGGQPGTWAWRITANKPIEAEVTCAVCKRTYSVRADAPGWSSVWTCCISCQASEENEWLNRGKK